MPVHFVDTNILLRYLTRDDEQKAQRALQLLMRVEKGEEKVVTSSLVIFEAVFTLQSFYKVSRSRIKELILPINHIYSWDTDFDKIEGLMRVEPA